MDGTQLFNELTLLLDEGKVFLNDELPHIFGNEGYVTVYPTTEEEISTVLKFANESGKQVVITGNGTKKGYGGIEKRAHINLSLKNYEGVLEHSPENLTVTVKSGTNFKELQSFLKEHAQQIPLDPKLPENATIGGVIAANDSGPKRFSYGSARDCVLGLKMIYPDGSILRFGGKVVKNVAGYDMRKLFIGSMGTLGVISEITLHLRPIPKDESVVFLEFHHDDEEAIRSVVVELLDTKLEPTTLELFTPHLSEKLLNKKNYTFVISFEGVSKAIQYEEKFVKKLIGGKNITMTVYKGEELQKFWNQFYSLRPNASITQDVKNEETTAVLKIGVKNLDIISILKDGDKLANSHNILLEGHGGAGHGLCELTLKGESEAVLQVIKKIRQYAEQLGGYCVVIYLPEHLRKEISVWGNEPSHFFLLEGIKKKIDPKTTLNAGRFVGGI